MRGRTHVVEVRPDLRDGGPVQEEPYHQRTCHEQQREGKQRIHLADDLIDRQHRGDDIVEEDNSHPHHRVATNGVQDLCRRIHEHRSHHDQQEHREHEHHALGGVAQIAANQIRQTGSVVAHGEHTRQIVVYGTGEDAA